MKKFISFTLALTLFAGFAAGCEDEDDIDTNSSKKSRSSSYSEEDTTKDITEEDTTEPVTTTTLTTTTTTTAVTTPTVPDEPSTANNPGENPTPPDINITPNTPIPVVGGDITGKWEVEKLVLDDGMEMTDLFGMPIAITFQIELRKDGTCILFDQIYDTDGDSNGTWVKNGNIVTIDIDGEVLDFELKNDRLIANEDDAFIYLMKVDKFIEYDF